MSTEATGDGKPDAAGATGPEAGAEGTEPAATAVDEPAADTPAGDVPRQAAGPGDAGLDDAGPDQDAGPDEPAGAGEVPAAPGADAARAGTEAEDAGGETGGPGPAGEPGEGDQPDEEGSGAGYEVYEQYEEYAEYEADDADDADDAAEPRRARRWPRVLLALGFVVLAAAIVGGAVAIVGSLTHGFKKPVKVTYKTSPVFSLKSGDCFNPQGQQSYTLVPCAAPHQAEVFATFALTGTTWPGNAAVQAKASDGCASRLTSYVNPQLAITLSSTYVYPDPVAWQAGTRTVICEVRATSGELTGSVRGASASAG